jgi:hypothetical protein
MSNQENKQKLQEEYNDITRYAFQCEEAGQFAKADALFAKADALFAKIQEME